MLLTDEKITERWLEGYKEQNLTLDEFDLEYLEDNLSYESMYALRAVAKAQLKQVVEWGAELCVWHPQTLPNGSLYASLHRRQCDECWQSLLKEIEQ